MPSRHYEHPLRPRNRPRQAVNDNDPVKAEYLRLVKVQGEVTGSVNTTLRYVVFLSVDQQFFVVSSRFQEEMKVSRKTIYNHLKLLERRGFIMKLDKRRGTFPRYMLTSIDAWRRLAKDDGRGTSLEPGTLTRKVGRGYTAKSHSERNDLKATGERSPRQDEHGPVPFRPPVQLEPLRPDEGANLPGWLRERFLSRFGLGAARSWLFRSSWNDADQVLEVANAAYHWFSRDARAFCRENGLSVRMRNTGAG